MEEQINQLKNVEAAIEAILFAAGYPVKYEKIAEVLGLDLKSTKTIIEQMSESYNGAKSIRGLNLLLFPDTCQLSTKEQFAPYIREALARGSRYCSIQPARNEKLYRSGARS